MTDRIEVLRGQIEWIVRNLDEPEKAAKHTYRGIAAIKHVAQAALAAVPEPEWLTSDEVLALAKFADEIIGDGDHCGLDGYDIEQAAIRAGLIAQVAKVAPCGPACACTEVAEDGEEVTCNTWTPAYVKARRMAAAPEPEERTNG